jgi:hypothetical protein
MNRLKQQGEKTESKNILLNDKAEVKLKHFDTKELNEVRMHHEKE